MPDLVGNALTVFGDPGVVTEFVTTARGRLPPTGNPPRKRRKNEPRPIGVPRSEILQELCFHALVPLPPEYSKVPWGNAPGQRSGLDIECETWGTKWGALNVSSERDPGRVTYHFETAWCAPHEVFLPKVAVRFPKLLFLHSWGGDEPTRGRAWFRGSARARRDEPYRARDYPRPEPEDEDEPDARDAWHRVANARLRTHPLWVGLTLAARDGQPFDPKMAPGPVLADWLEERDYPTLAAGVRKLDPTEPVGPWPAPARLARVAVRHGSRRGKLF